MTAKATKKSALTGLTQDEITAKKIKFSGGILHIVSQKLGISNEETSERLANDPLFFQSMVNSRIDFEELLIDNLFGAAIDGDPMASKALLDYLSEHPVISYVGGKRL